MPLSTSSSDNNSRPGRWFKTFILGLLIAIVLLGGWEFFWRNKGFTPMIEDDLGIWAVKRHSVTNAENKTIILLGSSRIQLDVDPLIIEAETGLRTLMLAIDGSSPLPILADLAQERSFNGVIICSFIPQWLADSAQGKSRSTKWVRKYHKQKWSSWIETRLSLLLQKNFVFRYPGLLPGKIWEKSKKGVPLHPPYAPMREDRYRPADYTRTDINKLRAARLKRQKEIVDTAQPLNEKEFGERIKHINSLVEQIRQNGNDVIFIRLPSSGDVLRLEEKTWPRMNYWDQFADGVDARSIHFIDSPELSRFNCPDGSHLDSHDAQLFTRALVDLLDLPKNQN